MGMTIDKDTAPMSRKEIVETLKSMVFGVQAFERFNAKERETLDKAWNLIDQYENRLKADMIAMFVRLNNEIDDLRAYDDIETVDKCEEIIQKEIDKLKEDNNESY